MAVLLITILVKWHDSGSIMAAVSCKKARLGNGKLEARRGMLVTKLGNFEPETSNREWYILATVVSHFPAHLGDGWVARSESDHLQCPVACKVLNPKQDPLTMERLTIRITTIQPTGFGHSEQNASIMYGGKSVFRVDVGGVTT